MAWSPGHGFPSTPMLCRSPDQPPVNDSAIILMADSGECGDEKLSAVFPTAYDGGLSGVGNPTAIFSVADDGSTLINEKCSATLSVADIDGFGDPTLQTIVRLRGPFCTSVQLPPRLLLILLISLWRTYWRT